MTNPSLSAPSPRPWAFWPFRVLATIETVMIFDQAIFAGQFLAGDFSALHTHRENATYTGLVLLVQACTGLLLWRPGRGPFWPALVCLVMFGLIAVQIVLGFSRTLALHVPLGVSLIVGTVLLLLWSWRARPGEWWPSWPGRRRLAEPAPSGSGAPVRALAEVPDVSSGAVAAEAGT